jgi:hypothetical protein
MSTHIQCILGHPIISSLNNCFEVILTNFPNLVWQLKLSIIDKLNRFTPTVFLQSITYDFYFT